MNVLTLDRLCLRNFKGITSFDLVADGHDVAIMGDNGTGKTTIADACTWLFTGKDTKGRADFALKPLDPDNNDIHHLETVVEGSFTFNGKPITLKKLFKENYTKKKGAAQEEFSGHVKEHWVDDIPKKQGEYQEAVKAMFDEETYMLVSDPMFFANMPWQRRREILLDMSGDVADLDVIKSDAKLAPLADLVKDRSIDDIRAMSKSQMRQINKDIDGIPPRISELKNQIADVAKPEDKELTRLEKQLQDAKDKLTALHTSEELTNRREQLGNITAELATLKADAAKEALAGQAPVMEKIKVLQKESVHLNQQIADCEGRIETSGKRIQISTDAMAQLRSQWESTNDSQASFDETCPTCGQPLPVDQIQAAKDKFNNAKASKLKKISEEGKSLKESVDERTRDIEDAKAKIDELSVRLKAVDDEIKSLEKSLESTTPMESSQEIRAMEHEKAKLEDRIAAMKNGTAVQERDVREKIESIQKDVDAWKKKQAEYEAAGKAQARIDELLAQEKTLAAEYEQLSHRVFLTDRFVVRKVEMLEDQINNRFSTAKFKLFKELVNGGIDDRCCEVLHNGIPFNSGLNTAARVNVGLDICQVLSEYYGLQATVWIDNKESINDLLPIQAQVVCMSVTNDKELVISKAEVAKAS